MSLVYKLHTLVPLFIITMPLLPIKVLKRIFFIPIILPIIWLIFGKCPINDLHKEQNDEGGFIITLLKNIIPDITAKSTDNLVIITMMLSIIISSYRIMLKYGVYK